jgi:hypothetical protein
VIITPAAARKEMHFVEQLLRRYRKFQALNLPRVADIHVA